MSTTTPEIRGLARRLVALEKAGVASPDCLCVETEKVCEKLRAVISRLVGDAGYASLVSRSLAMAKAEAAWLERLKVRPDGSLQGFEPCGREPGTDPVDDAGCVLITHLLGLLVTFIGPSLTLTLVRAAWPGATFDDAELGIGETQ